jgi:hypothetical protein
LLALRGRSDSSVTSVAAEMTQPLPPLA